MEKLPGNQSTIFSIQNFNMNQLRVLVLLLLVQVSCQEAPPELSHLFFENFHIRQYLFLFGLLLLAVIIRHVVLSTNTLVPYGIVISVVGLVWGYVSLHLEPAHYSEVSKKFPFLAVFYLQAVYLPALLFSTAFCLDVHTFMKSLSQIMVLSIPVSVLAAIATGQLMRQMVGMTWSVAQAALLGVILIPIYPGTILRWLRNNSVHTKYLLVLIEGEVLVSSAVGDCCYQLLAFHLNGLVVYWYQFACGILRWIIIGLPVGWFLGFVCTFLMRYVYNDSTNLMLLTFLTCYMSYYVGAFFARSGIIACTITALSMGRERPALLKEIEEEIVGFWTTYSTVLLLAYMIIIAVLIPAELSTGHFTAHMYFVVFVTYLMSTILRFFFSLLFSPFLSRMGYGMSFRNLVVCSWAGIKSPLCINLATRFLRHDHFSDISLVFFLHTSVLYLLMLLINAYFMPVLLRSLGLFDVSSSRQMNMTNCMNYLYETRARHIKILKLDRLLSDANWPLVMNSTALRHPYRKMQMQDKEEDDDDESEEDEDYFMRYKFTFCPDCQKNVPKEPTMKEMREMTKEAKLRLLKHKKTVYSRQYENGMISKEGVRLLQQTVELAMDSDELMIEVDGLLKMFSTENKCMKSLQRHVESLLTTKEEIIRMPRKKWRRWHYKLINNNLFYVIFMYTISALFIILLSVNIMFHDMTVHMALLSIFVAIFLLYCFDLYLKVIAFSYHHIWKDGVRTYFRSVWRTLEFVIIIMFLGMLFVHFYLEMWSNSVSRLYYLDATVSILMLMRMFRILNIFHFFEYCRRLGNNLSKRMFIEQDRNKALAYELCKSYIAGEDEILENLHQIVDSDAIREKLRDVTEDDRLAVERRLGFAELEFPWITIVVKTKAAIRSVLNSMKDDIYELKVAGFVDDVECHKLMHSLAEKYKEVYSVKFVEQSPPKMILKEVVYMNRDDALAEYFFANVSTRKYDPGNVVIEAGEIVDGIYVLITGMFTVTYVPNRVVIDTLKKIGAVPVVDYISVRSLEKPIVEYVTSGNSFGALSAITGRPYEGTVVAETYSEALLLRRDVILSGLAMDANPLTGLKARIWKALAFRTARTMMLEIPSYHSYTQEKLKMIVERSFVPNLGNYKVLIIKDMKQEILLIEGVVVDGNTRDIYVGPCYIPRAVQKLRLSPLSSASSISGMETKLMIIPKNDYIKHVIKSQEGGIGVLDTK